jgi:hypothetical protein
MAKASGRMTNWQTERTGEAGNSDRRRVCSQDGGW